MAKTSVNKAAAVRDYMDKHPEQKPKEVAAAVTAAIKVKVTPNYVSIIKSSANHHAALICRKRFSASRIFQAMCDCRACYMRVCYAQPLQALCPGLLGARVWGCVRQARQRLVPLGGQQQPFQVAAQTLPL